MTWKAKHIWLILLAQTACLALGLWMQYRYIRASADEQAGRLAWTELSDASEQLVQAFNETSVPAGDDASSLVPVLESVLQGACWLKDGVVFVDAQWREQFRFPAGTASRESTANGGTPQRLSWIPSTDPVEKVTDSVRGTLTLPEDTHLAVSHPMGDRKGHLLVHRPVRMIEAETGALLAAVPAIGALTLLWTAGPMSVAIFMIMSRCQENLNRERSRSANDALRQTQNLVRTRDAVIFGLAKLADSRDPETGDHLERISVYSTTLSTALRRHPKFRERVTQTFVRIIGISSALHDIGKVGIEDGILRKRGSLTPQERARMQKHTNIGGDCLQEIERRLGGSNFLQMAREIAYAHHERWDGDGYPLGLSGEQIPLAARIVAIVDVYDALSSTRVYKPPRSHEECVSYIREQAGKHFDPDLVEVWLTLESKFRDIARRYGNGQALGQGPPPFDDAAEEEKDQEESRELAAAVAS